MKDRTLTIHSNVENPGTVEVRLEMTPEHAVKLDRLLQEAYLWRAEGHKALGLSVPLRLDGSMLLTAVDSFVGRTCRDPAQRAVEERG